MPIVDVNVLKEWVQNWFCMNRYYHPYSKSNNIPIPELYDILERISTVDAVPVVRCGECKHYNAGFECLIEGYGIVRPKDWFCADGERREDGDNDDAID